MSGELQHQVSASLRVDSWLQAAGILLPLKPHYKESSEVCWRVGRHRRRKNTSYKTDIRESLLDTEEQLKPIPQGNRPTKGVNLLLLSAWKRLSEGLTQHILDCDNSLSPAPRITLQAKLLTDKLPANNFRFTRESGIRHVKRFNKGSRLSIGTSITPVHVYTEGDSRSDSPVEDRKSRRNRALHLSQAYCLLPAIPRNSVRDISAALKRKTTLRKAALQSPVRIHPLKSRSPKRNGNFQPLRRAF